NSENMPFLLDELDRTPTSAAFATAIKLGSLQDVERFVKKGADINCLNEKDQTPFMLACIRGEAAIAQFLLHNGAAENDRVDREDRNLLIHACSHENNAELVHALLDLRPKSTDKQDRFGYTAVMLASMHKNPEISAPLIERGANLNLVSNDGHT